MVEEEYPSGRKVKNEFESDGDISRIYGNATPTATERTYANTFSYTPDGRIEKLRLGNGLWEKAKFNSRLQVTEMAVGNGVNSGNLWKLGYEYGEIDGNGNVDTAKNTGNVARQTLSFSGLANPFIQTYKYDSLYRLTEARETNNSSQTWKQNFSYDRYGNRLTQQRFAGTTQLNLSTAEQPAIDAATNRLSAGQGFTFDKNGNLIVDADGRQFTFNGDNKQTVVRDASNNVIGQYFYDGEGKRVKKETDTETTVFVYSAGKLVAEYSTQLSQSPSIAYTTTDHLGTPRVITDQFGQVKARRDFMPFGEDIFVNIGARTSALQYNSTTDDIRQKFTGYQKDSETQLDFAEARMYENRFGRFTAVDPLLASGKSANPQTFNRYVYVGNNPIVVTDPMGLDWYRNGNKFQWSADNKVWDDGTAIDKDWSPVQFDSTGYYAYPCEGCDPGTKAYLYQIGGWDNCKSAQIYDSLMEHVRLANSFNDPKYLAVRNPELAEQGGAVMWSGAAILNKPSETYNFVTWGANKFGANLPYAPTLEPDENTPGAAKAFYYGTNGAFLVQGGVSGIRGIASGVNTIRSGGLSFSAYKATQGPSEILGTVPAVTRSGRTINYVIQTEQSHMFISQATQRAHNLPNWLVNNRINVWKLNTIQHALTDPQRFKLLPVGLKPQVGFSPFAKYNFFTRTFK